MYLGYLDHTVQGTDRMYVVSISAGSSGAGIINALGGDSLSLRLASRPYRYQLESELSNIRTPSSLSSDNQGCTAWTQWILSRRSAESTFRVCAKYLGRGLYRRPFDKTCCAAIMGCLLVPCVLCGWECTEPQSMYYLVWRVPEHAEYV